MIVFRDDLSSFTDGSSVRINDLGRASVSENSTILRNMFGNGFIVNGTTCSGSSHTSILILWKCSKWVFGFSATVIQKSDFQGCLHGLQQLWISVTWGWCSEIFQRQDSLRGVPELLLGHPYNLSYLAGPCLNCLSLSFSCAAWMEFMCRHQILLKRQPELLLFTCHELLWSNTQL